MGICRLNTCSRAEGRCLEDAIYLDCEGSADNYFNAFLQLADFCAAAEEVKRDQTRRYLSQLKLVALRKEAFKLGLAASGRKCDVVARILDVLFKTRVVGITLRL